MTASRAVAPPQAVAVKINTIPQELKAIPRWVSWKYSFRDGKWTKPPVNPKTGGLASTTDPSTWASFEEANAYAKSHELPGFGIIPPD